MRKKWLITICVLVLAVAAVWAGSALYATQENDSAPTELTLSSPAPTASTATPATPGTQVATENSNDLSGEWKTQSDSQAGYRVNEVLNGQNVTVVGRTSQLAGTMTVTQKSLTAATVDVDMASVSTDNDSRDKQFQGILKTAQFPTATFTLTEAADISAIESGPASVTVMGKLTVAGVTREVTADLTAQTTAAGVEVQGSIPLTFADFNVAAPNLGFVQVEDQGSIEMLLQLAR